MNILVLNGSPQKEKSDTMHITRAFVDGMPETAHHDIQTIHVIDRHIEFCQHTVQTADFAGIRFEKSEKKS